MCVEEFAKLMYACQTQAGLRACKASYAGQALALHVMMKKPLYTIEDMKSFALLATERQLPYPWSA